MLKKLLFVAFLFVVIVFIFSLFQEKPEVISARNEKDLLNVTSPPQEVASILEKSCYDCHSLETVYPSYASYFPISLLINNHVEEGRENANFSVWADYNSESKKHILEEAIEEIEEEKMPMSSYTLLHSEAKLNPNQKQTLLNWLKMQKEKL